MKSNNCKNGMGLVRYRNTQPQLFKMFFDDVFTKDSFFNERPNYRNIRPAANIKEDEKAYTIELAVPGLTKEDFSINLENDVLTISAAKSDTEETNKENYRRREFHFNTFKRSFTVPESVKTEDITAGYEQGVLALTLPKNEEAKIESIRQIKVG